MSRKRNSSADVTPADLEPQLPAELQALEATLATLVPRSDRLDADLFLFRAGQLSVRSRHGWLPTVMGALAGAAATLLVMLLVPSQPQVMERVQIVQAPENPVSPPGTEHPGPESWPEPFPLPGSRAAELERIDRLLQAGGDPWPRPSGVAGGEFSEPSRPLSYREYLEVLLESPPDRLQRKPSKRSLETGANS